MSRSAVIAKASSARRPRPSGSAVGRQQTQSSIARTRRWWIVTVTVAALMFATVAFAYSYREWFAGPRLLVAFAVLILLFTIRRRLLRPRPLEAGQRIAALVRDKRYREAIAIAENGELPYNDVPGYLNLVAAYYFNGNRRRAAVVLESLGSSLQYTGAVRHTIEDWQRKLSA